MAKILSKGRNTLYFMQIRRIRFMRVFVFFKRFIGTLYGKIFVEKIVHEEIERSAFKLNE